MSLKQRLTEDMKAAMKSGDKHSLGVIRLANAAIKQKEVDERIELDDAQVLAVLEKMVKQRRDSVSQYEAAGREDLATIARRSVDHRRDRCRDRRDRRRLAGRHRQADGCAQAAPRRPGRHGPGVEAGQAAAGRVVATLTRDA